jgi:hypothetical protein
MGLETVATQPGRAKWKWATMLWQRADLVECKILAPATNTMRGSASTGPRISSPEAPDMLIPRFSLRWLLLLTTVCAVFFLVVRFAFRGDFWAIGLVVTVVTLVVASFTYGLLFSLAFVLAALLRLVRPSSRSASPFATDALPPQVIPPRDVD